MRARLLLLLLVLGLSACTAPRRLDNAKRLIDRPDFQAARRAAPEWCRDALKTVNALELELEAK